MSKKVVGNINIEQVDKDARKQKNNDSSKYINFCDEVLLEQLELKTIEELQINYDAGEGLLNEYYLVNTKSTIDTDLLMKLQYATMTILYNLNLKMNEELTKKVSQQESISNVIKKQGKNLARENKVIKKELKTIVVTIIAIVLTISIIPTAIAGIENMPPKFILPFISTVILFGMIMIIFIFSIYNIKFSEQTWSILMAMAILFLISWIMCWNIDVNFTPRNIDNTQVNIYN